ncbi:MAG: hypothetical protein HY710_08290 [Candidatus Latescibacteria bacterium]|nr:hypothetical protein [Candidatus Latescibacterota bacterium]
MPPETTRTRSARLRGLSLCLALLLSGLAHAGPAQVPGVVHVDIDIGSDRLTVPQLTDLTHQARLGVIVFTDHDNAVVEYGLPPFRRLLKKQESRPSIQAYGAQRYVETIRMAGDYTPGVITIDGTEAAPAYYWEGNVWGGRPLARNIHKHLLVIGLPDPKDYERLPSLATGFPQPFGLRCLVSLWPLPVALAGLTMVVLSRRRARLEGEAGNPMPGVAVTIIGAAFLANSFPLCSPYDQYHGDPGDGPYQAVIDYANARGAMTFWAHPEVMQRLSAPVPWPVSMFADSVVFETLPYTTALSTTSEYTGFAIFQEGLRVIGKPGGVWDQVLIEYCAGARRRPVWAIGEADFEDRAIANPKEDLEACQTVFLLKERSRAGVLEALRSGTMYARRAPGHLLTLRDFRVTDGAGQTAATMGGHVTLSESPHVRIDLGVQDSSPRNLVIQVIRDGRVIRMIPAAGDTTITFEDRVVGGEGTTFYRLLVTLDDWEVLASNPIFVTIRPRSALQRPGSAGRAGV